MKLPRIAYIAIAGICVYIATKVGSPPPPPNTTAIASICEAAHKLDRISCGEKIFFPAPGRADLSEREK
jgi:hypothetical protein